MISKEEVEKFEKKSNARLNVNDLLERRKEEIKIDKKTNLIILSGVTALATIVLLILNL